MKIIACRMPDGSAERVVPVAVMLWWMQAGRTAQDRQQFVDEYVRQGNDRATVLRYMQVLDNPEAEIARKVANGTPEDVAKAFCNALAKGGISEDEALILIARISSPSAVEYLISDPIDPADAAYRHCLAPRSGRLEWDMPRAREHHRKLIRQARSRAFSVLDGQRAAAVRAKDVAAVTEIDVKAQVLADAPADPRIEAAQTVEELKRVWPEALGARA